MIFIWFVIALLVGLGVPPLLDGIKEWWGERVAIFCALVIVGIGFALMAVAP